MNEFFTKDVLVFGEQKTYLRETGGPRGLGEGLAGRWGESLSGSVTGYLTGV